MNYEKKYYKYKTKYLNACNKIHIGGSDILVPDLDTIINDLEEHK